MKTEIIECDICDSEHRGNITNKKIPVMFDHDQEDGKSKVTPYFEMVNIDICDSCFSRIVEKHILVYAYGAMGYNKYFINY